MERKQCSLMLALALVAGLIGGFISSQVIQPVFAEKESGWKDIPETKEDYKKKSKELLAEKHKRIVAEEFLLTDRDGNVRGRFGFGWLDANLVGVKEDRERYVNLQLWNSTRTSNFNLSVSTNPILSLYSKDSGRISLSFSPFVSSGPCVSLQDKDMSYRIQITMRPDGKPYICLGKHLCGLTTESKPRAILGSTELRVKKTGTRQIRSASSLVLFDEKGNVIWSTPE